MTSILARPRRSQQRNRSILAAIDDGMPPPEVARQFRVPLYVVEHLREAAVWRELFAREHAESGGPARKRVLGSRR